MNDQVPIINSFGLLQDECQNYVRVLAQPDRQTLLVCGTNSFKPKCRTYTTVREVLNTPNNNTTNPTTTTNSTSTTTTIKPKLIDDGILRMKHEFSGRGLCPLDPKHNSTAIYTGMKIIKRFALLKYYSYSYV